MASHGRSPDAAESETALASMTLSSQSQDDDDMIPLQPTQPEFTEINTGDVASLDSSSSRSRKSAVPRSRAKKARKAAHQNQSSKPPLRPANDILNRIRYDPTLEEADYVVGYRDRHAPGIVELDVSAWNVGGDVTDEEWIPQHRILYFRKKEDLTGRKVWDREQRLDRLFGSGIVDKKMEEVKQEEKEDENEQGHWPELREVFSEEQDRVCDCR